MKSNTRTPSDLPAILVVTFNRPDQTAQVLQAIKRIRPSELYVANDGPRPGRSDDIENVNAVRGLVSDITWCERVHTKFQPSNLGCGKAVSDAISWFLDEAGEGIILEDDCLPEHSFFRYCAEMLARYRDVTNVMQISGYNLIADQYQMSTDYILSNFGWVWGWATWSRAWKAFDLSMNNWARFKQLGLHRSFPFYPERVRTFDSLQSGTIDTWDYQWQCSVACQSGLAVVPRVNLVRNIGFGVGTHSKNLSGMDRYAIPVRPLEFPLRHWEFIYPDVTYDKRQIREAHRRTPMQKARRILSEAYRHARPKRRVG